MSVWCRICFTVSSCLNYMNWHVFTASRNTPSYKLNCLKRFHLIILATRFYFHFQFFLSRPKDSSVVPQAIYWTLSTYKLIRAGTHLNMPAHIWWELFRLKHTCSSGVTNSNRVKKNCFCKHLDYYSLSKDINFIWKVLLSNRNLATLLDPPLDSYSWVWLRTSVLSFLKFIVIYLTDNQFQNKKKKRKIR